MGIVLANNAKTTLAANVSSIDTTFYVDDIDGFPALDVGDYFYCTIESTTGAYEIVKVTQINATNFLVERGQEGTIAVPFNIGARVELRITAQSMEDFLLTGSNIDNSAFGVDWDGDTGDAPSRNAVYDKFVSISSDITTAVSGAVSDTTYGVSWDGVTTVAPSKNAIYDKIESLGYGFGDMLSTNNLSELTNTATARSNLGLVIGTHVQAYDVDTAKTDVNRAWTANQTFGGSDANVLTIYRSGAAAKLRFIESTNNNAWGIRNNANTLTFDYNSTDRLTLDGSGNLTLGAGLTTAGRNRLHGGPSSMPAAGAHDNATQIGNTDLSYGVLIGALSSGTGFIQAQRVDGTATTYQLNLNPNGSPVAVGGQLEITGGALSNTNGLHLYFGSNISRIYSLQNTVAWRDLHVDGATTYINANSLGPVVLAGPSAQVNYGSGGSSILYVGGANNQDAFFALRSNSGRSRGIAFYTGASSLRWFMETTSTAESGANAGSDFALSNWSDAGTFINTPLYIARATGVASFSARPVFNGNTALDTGNGAQLGVANSFTANQTITGALSATTIQGPPPVSSETTGTLTSASRNKIVQCSGGVTLPSSGMTDGDSILIDPRGTARTITRPAAHTMYIANTDSATGTTGAHNVVTAVYHGSSKWTLQGSVT